MIGGRTDLFCSVTGIWVLVWRQNYEGTFVTHRSRGKVEGLPQPQATPWAFQIERCHHRVAG